MNKWPQCSVWSIIDVLVWGFGAQEAKFSSKSDNGILQFKGEVIRLMRINNTWKDMK